MTGEPTRRPDLTVAEFGDLYDAGALSHGDAATFSIAATQFEPASADPRSEAYRRSVLDLWARIAGRDGYEAERDEAFDLDPVMYLPRPFPYSGGNPVEVGQYLGAVAWLLREVAPHPGDRVIELGAGWGHLSLSLAMLGCRTNAVDLNPASARLLRTRADAWHVPLEVTQQPFLQFDDHGLDLVIFFESFHHCDDPVALLRRCRDALVDGGRLVFLAEAIYDDFYAPWGVRLDGDATYMTRLAGWLELGFRRSFFYRLLLELGFVVDDATNADLGPYGTLVTATKGRAGSVLSHELPADEAATWGPTRPGLPGRFATERSRVTLPTTDVAGRLFVRLHNTADDELRVRLEVAPEASELVLAPGASETAVLELAPGAAELLVTSDVRPAAACGGDRVGVLVSDLGSGGPTRD